MKTANNGGEMEILCVSCSNVLQKKNESASTKVCELIREIVQEKQGSIQVETIRLVDYTLSNCIFCGQCLHGEQCIYDDDFNQIYQKIKESDRIILVVPFYSVIPSKLTMIMEKVNQIYYTAWLENPGQEFTLSGKKITVIAHGGSVLQDNPNAGKIYQNLLLKPLEYSLTSFGFDIVGLDEDSVKGTIFGVESYSNRDDAIFPDMIHNWSAIKDTISPLVNKLIQ
jgi:multimeric flavodoxin WrbA